MKAFGWVLFCALLCPQLAGAQSDTRPAPPSAPPPEDEPASPHTKIHISGEVYIGERAPDFVLDASNGQALKLSSTRGDWIILVFDERKEGLRDLRNQVDDARGFGAKIYGVAHEKSYQLESWSQREKIPFIVLADPTGEICSMYGLYNGLNSTADPGFVLIDRDGVVRMALLGQRLPPGDITRLARFAINGP